MVPIYNWQAGITGGFHFPEKNGDIVRSSSLEGLIKEVAQYRANRGIDPTQSERDVHEYLCSKVPQNCKGVTPKAISEGALEPRIVKYATNLILKQRAGQVSLVGADVAQKRASICSKCDWNVAYNSGCNSCGTNVQSILAGVRQLKQVKGAVLLQGCKQLGCDLKTEVWLDGGQVEAPKNYVSCWKNVQE